MWPEPRPTRSDLAGAGVVTEHGDERNGRQAAARRLPYRQLPSFLRGSDRNGVVLASGTSFRIVGRRMTIRYPFLEAVGQHEFTLPTFHAEFQLANRTDHRRTLPSQNAPAAPTVQVFSIGH